MFLVSWTHPSTRTEHILYQVEVKVAGSESTYFRKKTEAVIDCSAHIITIEVLQTYE